MPSPKSQYVVVRFVTDAPVIRHFVVYATTDYAAAQTYCDTRNHSKEAHEEYILMNKHDFELEYGEATE